VFSAAMAQAVIAAAALSAVEVDSSSTATLAISAAAEGLIEVFSIARLRIGQRLFMGDVSVFTRDLTARVQTSALQATARSTPLSATYKTERVEITFDGRD